MNDEKFIGFDGTEYNKCFRLAYDYLKQHYPPSYSGAYFRKATDDMTTIEQQHGSNDFLCSLVAIMYGELVRQSLIKGRVEK